MAFDEAKHHLSMEFWGERRVQFSPSHIRRSSDRNVPEYETVYSVIARRHVAFSEVSAMIVFPET